MRTPVERINIALLAKIKWHQRLAGVDPEPKKAPDIKEKVLSIVRGKK